MKYRLPPLSYNLRSLFVRGSSTLLTVIGIGATVAVFAGISALQQGFATLYSESGRSDIALFFRPGATSEGESAFRIESTEILKKECPEIATDEKGQPMASAEMYLAVRRPKLDGGETNVPIRGVEPMSVTLCGSDLKVIAGRLFNPGDDEVIVGKNLTNRIQACQVGEVLRLNSTPFKVVGIFEMTGPFQSEIWGDARRMSKALERPGFNRVIARLRDPSPEAFEALAKRLENDPRTPAKVQSEREYLNSQTAALSAVLFILSGILGTVMGGAAILTGMNTMFTALAARSHEIGILVSVGFKPIAVFFSFLVESFLIGLLGGAVGVVMVLPLNGLATGTTNFQTFTEVAFAFRVTPSVLASAIGFAMLLGVLGGIIPAWLAAYDDPVRALRRK